MSGTCVIYSPKCMGINCRCKRTAGVPVAICFVFVLAVLVPQK